MLEILLGNPIAHLVPSIAYGYFCSNVFSACSRNRTSPHHNHTLKKQSPIGPNCQSVPQPCFFFEPQLHRFSVAIGGTKPSNPQLRLSSRRHPRLVFFLHNIQVTLDGFCSILLNSKLSHTVSIKLFCTLLKIRMPIARTKAMNTKL